MVEYNNQWHMVSGIHFRVWTYNNREIRFWSCAEPEVIGLFKAMYSKEEYRSLIDCGKLKAAAYSKPILTAYATGELEPQFAIAALHLIRKDSFLEFNQFITDRLVGKKLVKAFEELYKRHSFSFDKDMKRVLDIMFGNDDDMAQEFMEKNQRELNRRALEYRKDYEL